MLYILGRLTFLENFYIVNTKKQVFIQCPDSITMFIKL